MWTNPVTKHNKRTRSQIINLRLLITVLKIEPLFIQQYVVNKECHSTKYAFLADTVCQIYKRNYLHRLENSEFLKDLVIQIINYQLRALAGNKNQFEKKQSPGTST